MGQRGRTNRHILVIRLTAMGDVAMTAPIVASVCRLNQDVTVDFLSVPFHEPFFARLPNFRFIGTNIRKEKSGVRGLWRLFRSLKANGYTDVVDIHNVLRTQVLRLLFRLAGCRVYSLDKGRSEKRRLVSGKAHHQLRRMTDRYAEVFRRAGLAVGTSPEVREREAIPAESPVSEKGSERWIGISPFAQHRGKMYPLPKMAEVVDQLLADARVRLFVFGGGEKERAMADELVTGRERAHNMIGTMRLGQEMALMSNLDVMLSMDSSAMHVSSIYGVRVVSVWGATHPYAGFLGYGQSEADVVQRGDLECRPCSVFGNKPCKFGDYRCFDIPASTVAGRIME